MKVLTIRTILQLTAIAALVMIPMFGQMPQANAAITPPDWMAVGVWAEYYYEAYMEVPGTPAHTTYKWHVTAIVDDPWDPYCVINYQIADGDAGTYYVYFADGEWQTYFPLKAFAGALPIKIQFDIGEISCYALPQSFAGWSGETYYDNKTGVLVCLNLASGAYYQRWRIKAASPGLINPQTPAEETLQNEINSLKTTVTQLQITLTQQETTISELQTTISGQQTMLTNLQTTLSNLETVVAGQGTVLGMPLATSTIMMSLIAIVSLVLAVVGIAYVRARSKLS